MRIVRALWGSSHPGPTLVVTALSAGLGIAAGLEAWRITLLAVAVFFGQLSIGISNDAIDADRDRAVGRTDKPIARGDVGVRTAWIGAIVCAIVALALSAPLGWAMLVVHAVVILSGWIYNRPLKSTPLSIVPFLVAFGSFPSLATLSAPNPSLAPVWASIAGATLGAAVHLTNVLPDLDADRQTGVRGLPHRLGARLSAVLAALGVVAGALAVLLGPVGGDVSRISVVSWVLFSAVVAVAVLTVVLTANRAPGRTLFRLVMLSALLLAAQLILSGGALRG
ncbi:4-hydroxybenzoate polyprenyltransferase [Microbacterium sp. SLBN-154]|uniref:UbiA family prenyltransferase n=1 Tax=Microbacterium sp. SLBN-154 TaxID=2768458 RepID=UPI00115394FF|nr:UbiA family prenyltransferase [Microbacterium sp. SLBN-154]TQK18198.1 4-hydroxybenzoate polyprenyltransferase [Microbacterium sp. SLBN-154]